MELANAIVDVLDEWETQDERPREEAMVRIRLERLEGEFSTSVILSTSRRRLVARGVGPTPQEAIDAASLRLARRLKG